MTDAPVPTNTAPPCVRAVLFTSRLVSSAIIAALTYTAPPASAVLFDMIERRTVRPAPDVTETAPPKDPTLPQSRRVKPSRPLARMAAFAPPPALESRKASSTRRTAPPGRTSLACQWHETVVVRASSKATSRTRFPCRRRFVFRSPRYSPGPTLTVATFW